MELALKSALADRVMGVFGDLGEAFRVHLFEPVAAATIANPGALPARRDRLMRPCICSGQAQCVRAREAEKFGGPAAAGGLRSECGVEGGGANVQR